MSQDERPASAVEEMQITVDVIEHLVLEGKIPMDGIDWRHTRSLSFDEWVERCSLHKPDSGKILHGEVCAECGLVIPMMVLAYKDGNVMDSWGGVLLGNETVCDDCSPI